MRYYVLADVHGFYSEMITALTDAGYFDNASENKLIFCGDLFDRGPEACKVQQFVIGLMAKDSVILIRGNHEDLMESLISDWTKGSYLYSHHQSNGTVDTVLQLTGTTKTDLISNPNAIVQNLISSPLVSTIIPSMINYYETERFIFVHGWIPCNRFKVNAYADRFEAIPDWRKASAEEWSFARWVNGMAAAHDNVIEKNKTIVCGHWHCSFGHCHYEGNGKEFGETANYSPYNADGITAIDACTALSHKVNCLVIDD